MAIRVKLDYLLLDRRSLTLTDLADRMGMTIANLSVPKTNKARAIRFSTLEALCRELRCQPGYSPERTAGEAGGRVTPRAGIHGSRGTETRIRGLNSVAHVATLVCRIYCPSSRGAASPEAAR